MVPGNLRMEGAGVLTSAMRNFEPMFEKARASSPVQSEISSLCLRRRGRPRPCTTRKL